MGNKLCNKNSVSPEAGTNVNNMNNVKLSEKTKTKVLMITTLCCSTVVSSSEPVTIKKQQTKTKVKQLKVPKAPNVNPNRPMNSKARVRRYGYQFAKVSPLIISVEELELTTEAENAIADTGQYDDRDMETEPSLEEYPEPPNIMKSHSMENLYIPEKTNETVVDEEERKRCRSAMLHKVKKNELTRKKMNDLRLIQAKLKRKEEKQRLKNSKQ